MAPILQEGVETMTWLLAVTVVLLLLVCGISGSLATLYRARQLRERERGYGIATPYLKHIAAGIGAVVGLVIGGVAVYYLSLNKQADFIEWVGRASYVLVAAASGGHILALTYSTLGLLREEKAWKAKGGIPHHTLGRCRREMLSRLRREQIAVGPTAFGEYKVRDEAVVDELLAVLGDGLQAARRNLNRLPFYGYLGTVCGILMMAEELSKINEATESFKVLSSMAQGLVLAFQTTLVALLAYLPLRKWSDYLIERVEGLEDDWVGDRYP